MALLKLFVNRTAGTLVKSVSRPESYVLPAFTQGDTVGMEVSVVEEAPTLGVGRYSLVSLAGYSLKIGWGARPIGSGAITPAALETSWTLDSGQTKFTGSLNFNTAAVTTLIGTNSSYAGWLEVELYSASTGYYETIFAAPATVNANLVTTLSSTPIAGDVALGVAQAAATYVPILGTAGGSIMMKSPDGTKTAILYVGDDGVFHADVV